MKKRILFILIFVVILTGVFVPQVFSMGKRPTKQTQAVSKTIGKVTDCDFQKSIITISTDAGTSSRITIDKNTSFSRGEKNIKSTDIKKGDVITVSYETKRGVNIAKSITVHEKTTPISTSGKGKK